MPRKREFQPPPLAVGRFATRYVQFLSERSIIDRFLGWVHFGQRFPFRDHVDVLEHDALGMFFYNQRALFFAAAGLFLATLGLGSFTDDDATFRRGTLVLAVVWLSAVLLTLFLHGTFRGQLARWATAHRPVALPPIFDRYFLIDCATLVFILVVGWRYSLPFNSIAFLLCANVIVYSAYTFIGRASRLTRGGLLLLFTLALSLVPLWQSTGTWFATAMTAATIFIMLLVTLFSVTMISALATIEHHVTRQQLALLGDYQKMLLGATANDDSVDGLPHSERVYRKKLLRMLRDLCNHRDFWYRAIACWFLVEHDDLGPLFWPGPYEGVPESAKYRDLGVRVDSGFLCTDEVVLLHSLKAQGGNHPQLWQMRMDLDAPAAVVPMRRGNLQVGALLIFGDEHAPPVPREDEQFLESLASIIVTSREQGRARFSAAAHKELDSLFAYETIDELFPAAVKVLRKYLFAAGCMIVFRPDPAQKEMFVSAVAGFSKQIIGATYHAGVGQTGYCAATGGIKRFDDVAAHRAEFDAELLERLEDAHGAAVHSWMGIPIGKPPVNYGVIKIVNRTDGPSWFTSDDAELGNDLAVRLHVAIEKYLHVAVTEAAKNEAQRSALAAREAQAIAESTARQRLQDLMTITHQMQAPLVGVVGALTGIEADELSDDATDLVEHARALIEDTITVTYGTFTTFALDAGRATAFFENDIDAVAELERLTTRMQRTNPRPEIRFVSRTEKGFPHLRLDGRVFTSVLYSLIHNAIKYADDYTPVILECSYERARDEPAIKIKSVGAPIYPDERELVFGAFCRGRSVQRGRLYTGVGLGLWVARRLMRALGGDLTVELSPDEPRLSVFVVHFPAKAVVKGVA